MTGEAHMEHREIGPPSTGAELAARVEAIKRRTNVMLSERRIDGVAAIANELLSFEDALFMQADIAAAIGMLEIASLLVPTGQYDPVERIFLKTIRIVAAHEQRTVFMWLHAVNNLAALYDAKGDYAARDRLNWEIVAVAQQLTTPLDASTAQIFAQLASMYWQAGHARPAAILYGHLHRFVMASPKFRADTRVSVMRSYGDALTADGHPETAREMYRQSLAAIETGPEFTERDRLCTLILMAQMAQQRKDLDEAEALLVRARDIALRSDAKDSSEAGVAYHNLASLYLQRRKRECYDEAEGLLEHALAIVAKAGRDSAEYAGGLAQLAVLLDAKGEHDRADAYFRDAFAAYEAAPDANPRELASFLVDAGGMYLRLSRDADAVRVFQRSRELQQSTADLGASTLANTMSGLATAHFRRGEFVQAIRWYRQAIELRQVEDGQQLEERAQA